VSTHDVREIADDDGEWDEPTPADLAAIESEWPHIAADVSALDSEIAELLFDEQAADRPDPAATDRRSAHRAARRTNNAVLRALPPLIDHRHEAGPDEKGAA
jgi:hypothetical protein